MQVDSTIEDARRYSAQQLAELLNSTPREQHGEKLLAMLECAEHIRAAIVSAKRAERNRARAATARSVESMQQLWFDIALFVTLGLAHDGTKRRGARNDNARWESLTDQQIENIVRAARAGIAAGASVLEGAVQRDDIDARSCSLHVSLLVTAIEAYQLAFGPVDDIVKYAAMAGTIGEGKQKSAPQVAMLALELCGYSHDEIARMLGRDPAEVRRALRTARVEH